MPLAVLNPRHLQLQYLKIHVYNSIKLIDLALRNLSIPHSMSTTDSSFLWSIFCTKSIQVGFVVLCFCTISEKYSNLMHCFVLFCSIAILVEK